MGAALTSYRGITAAKKGEWNTAEKRLDSSIQRLNSRPRSGANAHLLTALLATQLGRLSDAESIAARGLTMSSQATTRAQLELALARALIEQGRFDEALALLAPAVAAPATDGLLRNWPYSPHGLTFVALAYRGDFVSARHGLEGLLAHAAKPAHRSRRSAAEGYARACLSMSVACILVRDFAAGIEYSRLALGTSEQVLRKNDAARVPFLVQAGGLAWLSGRDTESRSHTEHAYFLGSRTGADPNERASMFALGAEIALEAGQQPEARAAAVEALSLTSRALPTQTGPRIAAIALLALITWRSNLHDEALSTLTGIREIADFALKFNTEAAIASTEFAISARQPARAASALWNAGAIDLASFGDFTPSTSTRIEQLRTTGQLQIMQPGYGGDRIAEIEGIARFARSYWS